MTLLICLLFLLLLQFIDYVYHNDFDIQTNNNEYLTSFEDIDFLLKSICVGAKRYDNIVGVFPFIWTWGYILLSAYMANYFQNAITYFVTSIFISFRIRSLQEISHFALHGTLTKDKNWGYFVSNLFFQYPFILPNISERFVSHCLKHHPNSCIVDRDPNIDSFVSIGFLPGITKRKFLLSVFYL